jgi:type VI secretion system protein ImpA
VRGDLAIALRGLFIYWFGLRKMLRTLAPVGSLAYLDLPKLLSPMAGDYPSGRDPRSDASTNSHYLAVKDGYDLAKEAERRMEIGFARDDEAERPRIEQSVQRGWNAVLEHGPEVLTNVGKDLRVTVWLSEGLLRLRGLGGLRDGLLLATGLVEQYWEGLFPQPEPDDEDGDARLLVFRALDGNRQDCLLAPALRKLRLSDGAEGEPVRFWEYESGTESGGDGDTPDTILKRLERSAAEFKRDLVEDAEACAAATVALEQALQARCGGDAPGFSGLRELTGQIADAVRPFAELTAIAEAAAPPDAPSASAGEQVHDPLARPTPQRQANGLDRQSAFLQLSEIAAFFRRTEPHSPIAYALENVVRRGNMTLPELLQELIGDDAARQGFILNAGMQPPKE